MIFTITLLPPISYIHCFMYVVLYNSKDDIVVVVQYAHHLKEYEITNAFILFVDNL